MLDWPQLVIGQVFLLVLQLCLPVHDQAKCIEADSELVIYRTMIKRNQKHRESLKDKDNPINHSIVALYFDGRR